MTVLEKDTTVTPTETEIRKDPPAMVPPTPPGGGNPVVRVTVNLGPRAVASLERLSSEDGVTKTEVINRAIQVYEIVQNLIDRSGGSLSITLHDGTVERLHIV